MGQMKTFRELQESEIGQIYNTSPKTYKEWEDPEILIVGFGRMLYSQLKNTRFIVRSLPGHFNNRHSLKCFV